MLQALYFILEKTSGCVGFLMNLKIPLTDDISLEMYWILFLIFSLYMFLKVAYQYLKGEDIGPKH